MPPQFLSQDFSCGRCLGLTNRRGFSATSLRILVFPCLHLQEAIPHQVKYSAFDRELVAAYSPVRHFWFLLEGRDFTLFTDQKPLTHSLFRVSPPWSARQQGQLFFISEFTGNLVHLPGSQNVVADALSRPSPAPPLATPLLTVSTVACLNCPDSLPLPLPVYFSKFFALKPFCLETSSLLSNTSLPVVSLPSGASFVLCDLSTGSPRPLLPVQLRCRVY